MKDLSRDFRYFIKKSIVVIVSLGIIALILYIIYLLFPSTRDVLFTLWMIVKAAISIPVAIFKAFTKQV